MQSPIQIHALRIFFSLVNDKRFLPYERDPELIVSDKFQFFFLILLI